MPLSQFTPFRQLSRAYMALLDMSKAISELPSAQKLSALETEMALAEIKEAILASAPSDTSLGEIKEAILASAPKDTELRVTELREIKEAILALAPKEVVDPEKFALHNRLGFHLLLDKSSQVDRALIESGEYEPVQLAYFSWLIERLRGNGRTMFLDIGAYWGLYSLIAHRSGAFDRIVAIEGDRDNCFQLHANLLLNGATRTVATINKAASENDYRVMFRDSSSHADGNRGGTSVLPENSEFPGHRIDAISVDSVVADAGFYILMKIDVEGFEPYVLRGMTETIRKNKVLIQIEVFDQNKGEALKEITSLGLRTIHTIYPDYYMTNIPELELGV